MLSVNIDKGAIILLHGGDALGVCDRMTDNELWRTHRQYGKDGITFEYNSSVCVPVSMFNHVVFDTACYFDLDFDYLYDHLNDAIGEFYLFTHHTPENDPPTYMDACRDREELLRGADPLHYVKKLFDFLNKNYMMKKHIFIVYDWSTEQECKYVKEMFGNVTTMFVGNPDSELAESGFLPDFFIVDKQSTLTDEQKDNYC